MKLEAYRDQTFSRFLRVMDALLAYEGFEKKDRQRLDWFQAIERRAMEYDDDLVKRTPRRESFGRMRAPPRDDRDVRRAAAEASSTLGAEAEAPPGEVRDALDARMPWPGARPVGDNSASALFAFALRSAASARLRPERSMDLPFGGAGKQRRRRTDRSKGETSGTNSRVKKLILEN